MTIKEVWDNARAVMAPNCHVCPVCDGRACKGEIPGTGGARDAAAWTACTEYLRAVKLNIDTVYDYTGTDSTLRMFGREFKYPIFIAPIGGMGGYNYNEYLTLEEYSMRVAEGAKRAGILSFTGDGIGDRQFLAGVAAAKAVGGLNVPTMKPFSNEKLLSRVDTLRECGCIAVACDIDAAGFVNMSGSRDRISPKGVDELRELTEKLGIPFILKGVMTPKGALKAAEAGCAAIVVSTHGGRVIDSAPGTCEVLPEIRAAVGNSLKIIVDGGIRTGSDIFKALALGADAAMIGRTFTIAAYGGGAEGVELYADKLGAELQNAMLMCGASRLSEITMEKVRLPK